MRNSSWLRKKMKKKAHKLMGKVKIKKSKMIKKGHKMERKRNRRKRRRNLRRTNLLKRSKRASAQLERKFLLKNFEQKLKQMKDFDV